MQDWSKMRKTWQDNRNAKHVPSGLAGSGVNIGGALDKVGVAQSTGVLSTFTKELDVLDAKLTKYRAALTKAQKAEAKPGAKAKKDPKAPDYKGLATWIEQNLAAWVVSDTSAAEKEAKKLLAAYRSIEADVRAYNHMPFTQLVDSVGLAKAKAEGKDKEFNQNRQDFPFTSADAKAVGEKIEPLTSAVANIIATCRKLKAMYPAKSHPIVRAMTELEVDAEHVQDMVTRMMAQPTWYEVATVARAQVHGAVEDVEYKMGACRAAVEKRIGKPVPVSG